MAFLLRVTVMTDATPCVLPRGDLLRLLSLARLADTHLFWFVAKSPAEMLVTDPNAVRAAIDMARPHATRLRRRARRDLDAARPHATRLRRRARRDLDAASIEDGTSTDMAKPTRVTATPATPAASKGARPAAKAKQPPSKAASKAPSAKGRSIEQTPSAAASPPKPATVTLKQIAADLGAAHGLDPKAAQGVIATLFQSVATRLKAGDKVRLDGFGVIEVQDRPARTGRNPGTGETIQIAAKRKLVFRPAKELKDTV